MKIKITPETDLEKQKHKEVVHHGVQEFLIFGNKKDDESFDDFHDWKGSFRYLLGSLYYFCNQITEEQNLAKAKEREEKALNNQEMDIKPTQFKPNLKMANNLEQAPNLKVIDTKDIEAAIQRGKANKTIQDVPTQTDEFVTAPVVVENESKAEDS